MYTCSFWETSHRPIPGRKCVYRVYPMHHNARLLLTCTNARLLLTCTIDFDKFTRAFWSSVGLVASISVAPVRHKPVEAWR